MMHLKELVADITQVVMVYWKILNGLYKLEKARLWWKFYGFMDFIVLHVQLFLKRPLMKCSSYNILLTANKHLKSAGSGPNFIPVIL